MRKVTVDEMACVGGGMFAMGDLLIASGNGVASGNHVTVKDVLNGNSIANGSLNGSLNGTGIGNYSGNS